ncbi:MAG: hypothetical protein H6830_01985 [Planctomycetes bacterium]|nr:hypothetical protein [Planctomycetota bacterium]MCB9910406.1 hypothetical protein [Planctomycetota bacterium]HPF13800.1 hypothetical protein [Planctomycetota bacterium]HRV79832.1 hypothetical protein [Planctomycetota bacterium]
MIRINLLPDEYRRRTRMPVKKILAIAGATAINASLFAYWGWLTMGVAKDVEGQYAVRKTEMDGLTPQVTYHKALEHEIQLFSSREKTLSQITMNRVLWTQKMDELIDIVNAGNDIEHFVWFDDVTAKLENNRNARSASYGTFEANGHSGSEQWNRLANFLDDVADTELTPFILDFETLNRPQGRKNESSEDLIPKVNWAFPLKLSLRSPEERLALRLKGEAQ